MSPFTRLNKRQMNGVQNMPTMNEIMDELKAKLLENKLNYRIIIKRKVQKSIKLEFPLVNLNRVLRNIPRPAEKFEIPIVHLKKVSNDVLYAVDNLENVACSPDSNQDQQGQQQPKKCKLHEEKLKTD